MAVKDITDQITDCEFDLITARHDKTMAVREKIGNVNVFRVGSKLAVTDFILHKNFFPIAAYRKGKKLLSQNNYDLIFVLQASQAGGAVWLLKRAGLIKQPVVLNLQEGRDFGKFNPIRSYFFKLIISSADLIVSISEHLKQVAIRHGAIKSKIRIIPNGVDLNSFSHEFSYGELSGLSDQLGIKPDEKVIITASRLTYKNGVDDLIKAVAILTKPNSPDKYKLIIVGDGDDKKKLVELVRNLNIIDNVVFVGSVEHHRLPKYLRLADVFVRPSRSEGLGTAFLEAMAAGVPVIGTPVGGILDFLKDGETGLFCNVGNSKSIADKVELLFSDSKLQNHIIKEGYKMVVANYDWKKIAGDYQKVFNSLIG